MKCNMHNCFSINQNGDIAINKDSPIICINGTNYSVERLSEDGDKGSKGGNSVVFKLKAEQEDYYSLAMKISKYKDYYSGGKSPSPSKKNKRFYREIDALIQCKKCHIRSVINIHGSGLLKLQNEKGNTVFFPYYFMEYADGDLKSFLEHNFNEVDFQDKVDVCLQIANGINDLHTMGIYHRDIKPDNILLVGNDWKIGDLGLIDYREQDNEELYSDREFIGPKGWSSPEAMNRYLAKGLDRDPRIDCIIDDYSDVFQLGKLFWYIIQGNAPIGGVVRADFFSDNNDIFSVIAEMLIHDKSRRLSLPDVLVHDNF